MNKFVRAMMVLFCLAVTVSVATAAAPTVQVLSKGNISNYAKNEKSKFLAGKHISEKTADCVACHTQNGKLDDSNTQVNAQCISCHGSLDDLAKTFKPKDEHAINPHTSHLGKISCTACHGGHEPSALYCNNCHTFESKISFKGEKPFYKLIDVAKYANSSSKVKERADIVIIGAGGAGHIAALTARASGAKNIVVLEKMPIVGGNSQLAAGGMNAAGTKYQKEQSIPDSPQIMYEDTMKGGKNLSNPDLVKVLANESAASMAWLDSIGAKLDAVNMGGGATFKRFHAPTGGLAVGSYLVNIYKGVAEKEKLDIRTNSPVVRILSDKKGNVTGVLVSGIHSGLYEIEAKSVVLTSGGFSANAERVVNYQPSYKGMATSNQPGATGDGLDLAKEVNAEFIDMKEIQIHPTVAFGSGTLITEAVRGVGAILVNQKGERFFDELSTRDKVSAATLQQPGGYGYLILDDTIRQSLKQIEGYFHLNLAVSAPTLAELAKKINVPADMLEKTVADYNSYFDAKDDKAFGRKSMQAKLVKGDFVAIKVTPGVHYTMGGVKIDTKSAVIGKNDKPIKNFYAAGEVTGGVHGANRLGGNSISETVTFGRIAGFEAYKNSMQKAGK